MLRTAHKSVVPCMAKLKCFALYTMFERRYGGSGQQNRQEHSDCRSIGITVSNRLPGSPSNRYKGALSSFAFSWLSAEKEEAKTE